jgi:hypothetical protein
MCVVGQHFVCPVEESRIIQILPICVSFEDFPATVGRQDPFCHNLKVCTDLAYITCTTMTVVDHLLRMQSGWLSDKRGYVKLFLALKSEEFPEAVNQL